MVLLNYLFSPYLVDYKIKTVFLFGVSTLCGSISVEYTRVHSGPHDRIRID